MHFICDLSDAVPAMQLLYLLLLCLSPTAWHLLAYHLMLLNLLPVGHGICQEAVNHGQVLCRDDEIVLFCDASFLQPGDQISCSV